MHQASNKVTTTIPATLLASTNARGQGKEDKDKERDRLTEREREREKDSCESIRAATEL
jgi:hypothetical protein